MHEQAFKAFDKDGDGTITLKEIKGFFSGSGGKIPDKTVKALIKEMDKNNDGKISKEEFMAAMQNPEK